MSFRRLGRIGFDEATVGVRQIHAKIMEPDLLAADVTIGFAKVRLGMTRTVAQWHEHLAVAQRCLRHVLPYNRIAAGKSLFVTQPLEDPAGRMALLLVDAAIAFKDRVDPRHARPELLRNRAFLPPVAGRDRKLQHLRNRVAVNAKAPRRLCLPLLFVWFLIGGCIRSN